MICIHQLTNSFSVILDLLETKMTHFGLKFWLRISEKKLLHINSDGI